MAKMIASAFVGNGSLRLYLNNELVIKDSDSVLVDVEENTNHIVHWFVSGHGPYSITISSPKEAEFQLTKMVSSAGKDIDSFSFRS